MTDYYADSSVLVKRHVVETGSSWMQALAAPAANNLLITARISVVEVISAFNRRLREARLDPTDYSRIALDFNTLCATEYQFIELTDSVVVQAQQLLEQYPLRAYDATQLASAIIANREFTAAGLPPILFLSADDRLLSAATAEGLTVDNPNLHV